MNKLRVRFSAGLVEEKTFRYIGFGIQQLPIKIILDHSEYIDTIKNVTIDPKRASENNETLNERQQKLFRQIKGQLNWAVQGSRPGMAFDMIAMSTKLKQGKVGDLVRAIMKICRLKDIRSYMTFPELDKMKELKMVVFTDASLCNINKGTKSTGAFIIWVMDNCKLLSCCLECTQNQRSCKIYFSGWRGS